MAKQDKALPCCKGCLNTDKRRGGLVGGKEKMHTLHTRIYTANFFDNAFHGKYNHEKQMFLSDIPSTSHALIQSGIFFQGSNKGG